MPDIEMNSEYVEDVDNGSLEQTDFTNTMMQQFEDIRAAVAAYETVTDYWGEDVARYYAVDVQDNEVIVVDRKNNYNYYGIAFSVEGDKPVIDFACTSRKKVRYENYDDGTDAPETMFGLDGYISEIEKNAHDKVAEATENYSRVKTELDEIKPKYDEYVAAEEKRLADEVNAAKDAKLAEYEDCLGDVAEFVAIKDNKDELTVDEIEKECAVLYVKSVRASKSNFTKGSSSPAVGIIDDKDDDDTDGYVSTKYGLVRKRY